MNVKLNVFFLTVILAVATTSCRNEFRSEVGGLAHRWTGELVGLGPRAPGTAGIEKSREWIEKKVFSLGFALRKRPFVARTPKGLVNMVNLTYVIPGAKREKRVMMIAHYDSKYFTDRAFVGANDAASSVALLLAISQPIQKLQLPFDVEITFVDGEEAFVEWNFKDSLYGSRQLAQDLKDRSNVLGVFVVDMIGDKDLSFIRSRGVNEKLLGYFSQALSDMSMQNKLEDQWSYVMDDHTPFSEMGMPTLHIMDFTFGGKQSPGSYWHTENDNMESISSESLSITGEAILRTLKKI